MRTVNVYLFMCKQSVITCCFLFRNKGDKLFYNIKSPDEKTIKR